MKSNPKIKRFWFFSPSSIKCLFLFPLFDACVKQCCPAVSGILFGWVVLTTIPTAASCFNFQLLTKHIVLFSIASWGGRRWRGKCWAPLPRSSDRICWNSSKLHQGRFRLDIRKSLSLPRRWKHWKKLPGEVVDAPRLSVLKRHLENALNSTL